jgi:hypothetical protein
MVAQVVAVRLVALMAALAVQEIRQALAQVKETMAVLGLA